MAEMIRFVKSLTVVVNRLTASVNKLAPKQLESAEVVW